MYADQAAKIRHALHKYGEWETNFVTDVFDGTDWSDGSPQPRYVSVAYRIIVFYKDGRYTLELYNGESDNLIDTESSFTFGRIARYITDSGYEP